MGRVQRTSVAAATAAALLAGAALVARTAGQGTDVDATLEARLTTPITQYPCVRLLSVGNSSGCSSAFGL